MKSLLKVLFLSILSINLIHSSDDGDNLVFHDAPVLETFKKNGVEFRRPQKGDPETIRGKSVIGVSLQGQRFKEQRFLTEDNQLFLKKPSKTPEEPIVREILEEAKHLSADKYLEKLKKSEWYQFQSSQERKNYNTALKIKRAEENIAAQKIQNIFHEYKIYKAEQAKLKNRHIKFADPIAQYQDPIIQFDDSQKDNKESRKPRVKKNHLDKKLKQPATSHKNSMTHLKRTNPNKKDDATLPDDASPSFSNRLYAIASSWYSTFQSFFYNKNNENRDVNYKMNSSINSDNQNQFRTETYNYFVKKATWLIAVICNRFN
ncbi:MAG: hypothetical protein JO129_03805 [Candidatus Dependentiae bacterium]|nr:hypothetical protein [Candidatus Dependentiae bacterium]